MRTCAACVCPPAPFATARRAAQVATANYVFDDTSGLDPTLEVLMDGITVRKTHVSDAHRFVSPLFTPQGLGTSASASASFRLDFPPSRWEGATIGVFPAKLGNNNPKLKATGCAVSLAGTDDPRITGRDIYAGVDYTTRELDPIQPMTTLMFR